MGLGVGLSQKNDDEPPATPAPTTPAPTPLPPPTAPPVRIPVSLPPRPTLPTLQPTGISGKLPAEIELVAIADTTIYRDGVLAEESHGSEDSMLVQNGEAGNVDLPSTFALIQFDLNGTSTDFTDFINADSTVAIMCLDRLPGTEEERVAIYSTCVVLPSDDAPGIETWTAADAPYTIPDDCQGGAVEFNVSSSDGMLCIDVTSALPTSTSTSRLRGRDRSRQLQDTPSFLFMIDGAQQGLEQAGDRFYTREAANADLHPTLTFTQDGETVSPSEMDTETASPTNITMGDYDPCGICEDGEMVTLPDAILPIPAELLPDGLPAEEASCALVDAVCSTGYCSEEVCATIAEFAPTISPICGCELEI